MKDSNKNRKCKRRCKKNKRSRSAKNPFQNIFKQMDKMFNSVHTHMKKVKNNPNSHSYSSSMVMSYHKNGKSQPRMMQASTSTRKAPGKIKETRRTYRNSDSGVEKISIGRHIGKRGHEHKKKRVRGSGIEEKQKFYEMNEDELPNFEKEWKQLTAANKMPFRITKAVRNKQKRKGSSKCRKPRKK